MASCQAPGKDNESSGRGKRGWVWRPVRSRGRITRARGGGRGRIPQFAQLPLRILFPRL